ncbi:hypothetical protein Gpo141_00013349, partial [Globisporangium polare]
MQVTMEPNWPRTQVLPSLFKSEPSALSQKTITLRPLIAAAIQRHDATPLLLAYQSQSQQQAYYSLLQQQQQAMPIKREPESSAFDFGHRHY